MNTAIGMSVGGIMILAGLLTQRGDLGALISLPALLIVVGPLVAYAVASVPHRDLLGIFLINKRTITNSYRSSLVDELSKTTFIGL